MSDFLDSTTAQTGQPNEDDWQEELYQRIQFLKESYLEELHEIYLTISRGMREPRLDKVEKLRLFRLGLERIIAFLLIYKSEIAPIYKNNLACYEKNIANFINMSRGKFPLQPLPPPRIDWQGIVYQKVLLMNEYYIPELNQMYQKVTTELEKHNSLRHPRPDLVEKLKVFKMMLERIMKFLNISKSNITPYIKANIGSYQQQITNFLDANAINYELQANNMQDYVAMMLQEMVGLTLFDVSDIAQSSKVNSMQPSPDSDSD